MKNLVWSGSSSGLDGEFKTGSDIDFYIDEVHCVGSQICDSHCYACTFYISLLSQDMIHIADTQVARRYGEIFSGEIRKLDLVCQ